jgi:hypothetical protein
MSALKARPEPASADSSGNTPYFGTISWSPDGQSLAFDYKGAIYVATIGNLTDCTEGTFKQVIAAGSTPTWGPAAINPSPRPPNPVGSGGDGGSGSGAGGGRSINPARDCVQPSSRTARRSRSTSWHWPRVTVRTTAPGQAPKPSTLSVASGPRPPTTSRSRWSKCEAIKNNHKHAACIQKAKRDT